MQLRAAPNATAVAAKFKNNSINSDGEMFESLPCAGRLLSRPPHWRTLDSGPQLTDCDWGLDNSGKIDAADADVRIDIHAGAASDGALAWLVVLLAVGSMPVAVALLCYD